MKHFTVSSLFTKAFFSLCLLALSAHTYGQVEHPKIISFSFNPSDDNYIGNWSPGNSENEEFHISRVPLADRFEFKASQTNQNIPHKKKISNWVIMNPNTRNGDAIDDYNPHYWQYQDMWQYWSPGSARLHLPPASYTDAGHRNGCKIMGGLTFADPTQPSNSKFVELISKNSDGTYKHARRMVLIAKHFGFDGYAFNIEVTTYPSSIATQTRGLFQEMTRIAHEEENMPHFELTYYYVHYNSGSRSFGIRQVDGTNNKWLEENGKTTFTQAFLNYEWNGSSLQNSANYVKNNFPAGKNDPYDRVFAGLNMPGVSRGQLKHPWKDLLNNETSIALWEEKSWKDRRGMTPEDKRANFYSRAMNLWVGPNGDPSQPGVPSSSSGKTKRIAGMAAHVTAKSSIDSYPLVTNFNDGCGNFFAKAGEVAIPNEWNNTSIQDMVPTWRWWWSQGGQSLEASMDFLEAYEGGSSLKVTGNVSSTDNVLRLFKTKLPISNATQLEITYKVEGASAGSASNVLASLAFENGQSLSSFSHVPVGNTTKDGWNTVTLDLSSYSGQTLAVLGLNFKGSSSQSDYTVHIGGMSLTDGAVSAPDAATAINVAQLQATGRYISGRLEWALPGNPRFNESSNVEYFEAYQVSNNDQDSVFLGRSIARAMVFKNIMRTPGDGDMKFAIVSVGKDHKTTSSAISSGQTFEPGPWAKFNFQTRANIADGINASCESNFADSYQWTFQDGTPATSTAQNPGTITYTTPGVKSVTLTVTNATGSYDIETQITIGDASTNLALFQPSYRSTPSDYKGPERGNDGTTSNMYCGKYGLVHTPGIQPWWTVDLGRQVKISEIKAFHPSGTKPASSNYHIFISKTPFESEKKQETVNDPGLVHHIRETGSMQSPSSNYDLSSDNVVGRYVRIQLDVANGSKLQFSEFEVYGEYAPDVVAGPTATLSLSDHALISGETATLTATFDQAVTGFTNDDLTFSNGTLTNVTSADNITFTATFTPNEDISVSNNTISLDLSGVTDADGNAGFGTVSTNNFSIHTQDQAPSVTLGALADSYAYGKNTGTNYGSSNVLLVKQGGSTPYVRRTYIKFDGSQLPATSEINSATLRVSIASVNNQAKSVDFEVREVTDNSWTENGINWSNKPAPQSTVLATFRPSTVGETIEIDLTSFLQNRQGQGDVSLEFRSGTKGPAFIHLHSKEASDASLRPELAINEVASPALRQASVQEPVAEQEPKIGLYPNPAEHELNVMADSQIENVRVFDTRGQLLIESAPKAFSCALDVNALPAGVYAIIVVTEDGTEIRERFMKK
ncbi:hypothetical protein FUAX_14490 [Fulvitalea axinellae]|uniref:Mannosyl-glycoprotein endo-beta-N-acetylglucosaminidase n=1 Tax=Fulvitalea axinellae TaxID=1182444 RepID=A0AAU9CPZ3_9BACT|nr:hypothetical protein FUAX_14490 [Fulvitalea axinellae]